MSDLPIVAREQSLELTVRNLLDTCRKARRAQEEGSLQVPLSGVSKGALLWIENELIVGLKYAGLDP